MTTNTVLIARQLLSTISQSEMRDLIALLEHFNNHFKEEDRVRALDDGSNTDDRNDQELERRVKKALAEGLLKSAGSQNSYISSNTPVCALCGK